MAVSARDMETALRGPAARRRRWPRAARFRVAAPLLALILAGQACIAYREGDLPPPARWPLARAGGAEGLSLAVSFNNYIGAREVSNSRGYYNWWRDAAKEAYLASGLFSEVTPGDPDADLYVEALFVTHIVEPGLLYRLLTMLTATLAPKRTTYEIELRQWIHRRGRVVHQAAYRGAVQEARGLGVGLLFPFFEGTDSETVALKREMLRRAIADAFERDAFDPAPPSGAFDGRRGGACLLASRTPFATRCEARAQEPAIVRRSGATAGQERGAAGAGDGAERAPVIAIYEPRDNVAANLPRARVFGMALDLTGGDPVSRVELWVNGVMVADDVRDRAGRAGEAEERFGSEIGLRNGTNVVRIVARATSGRSASKEARVFYDERVRGALHVLVAGVGEQDDPALADLSAARIDARNVYAFLRDDPRSLADPEHVHLVEGADATGRGLRRAIERRLIGGAMSPADAAVLYFAGHERAGLDGQGAAARYLLPRDAARGDLRETGLSSSELNRLLKAVPGRRRLFVADTCRSEESETVREAAAEGFDHVADGEGEPGGATALVAASPGECFVEAADGEGSVFAHWLLRGLEGEADAGRDGLVSAAEAGAFVVRRAPEDAAARGLFTQPMLRRALGPDLYLAHTDDR